MSDAQYWLENLRAFLRQHGDDKDPHRVRRAPDPQLAAIIPVPNHTRQQTAEAIHRLERAGFAICSTTEAEEIRVAVRPEKLPIPYTEEDDRPRTPAAH